MAVASFTVSDLRQFAGNVSWSSLAMPTVVLIVLAMLVLPMPPIMLDIFFTFNILLALLIIMVEVKEALAFITYMTQIFPRVLDQD